MLLSVLASYLLLQIEQTQTAQLDLHFSTYIVAHCRHNLLQLSDALANAVGDTAGGKKIEASQNSL